MGARSSNAKIWGWAVTQRKCFKWFNYSRARAHPGCKVSCHGTESTCIIGSSMLHWGQSDSGEGYIMLQSGLTYSLVAKFPQHSVVACSTQISCCRRRTLRTRQWVCVNLWCLMLWHPKCIRTIAAVWAQGIYLQIHYANMVGSYTNPKKPQKCQNWGMGACMGMGTFPGQYGICYTPRCEW